MAGIPARLAPRQRRSLPIAAWDGNLPPERPISIPIWAFYGDTDDIIPLEAGEKIAQEIKGRGGDVRWTVYPGVRHDTWTQTYLNPEFYRWLLEHQKEA